MRFLADANVELRLVKALREQRHDVAYVREIDPLAPDEEILTWAYEQRRILLTNDRDFCFLVFRLGLRARGVVLLRLAALPARERLLHCVNSIARHENELEGSFCVVNPGRVRIRPLPLH